MKKRVLTLLFATVAACFACGCGGESSGSIIILDGETDRTQKTELTVYGHRTDRYSLSVFENALQGFMAASPVNVSYESASGILYWQALDRRFKTDNLDDVFMTEHDRLMTMAAEGALANLSGSVNTGIFNDFATGQIYGENGAVYAVPASISTYGLYINYDLLESHGKQVPKNLSEFTAVCDYFADKGVTPIICNNYSSLRSLIIARGMYDTYCTADTAKEIEKFNENPALLADALNGGIDFVYGMIESGWIDAPRAALTEHLSDDLQLFISGEYPFMITGGWASSTVKEMLAAEGRSLKYGIHAYPVLDSGRVLVAQADALLCVKKGENEQDAKRLLSVLTGAENLLLLSESQSSFSPLKGQTQIYADSAIIPSASYLNEGRYVISSDNNLKVPLDTYLTECGTMILDGASAADVKVRLLQLLNGFKAANR